MALRPFAEYFATSGSRAYEDRVYSNLGEHYLAQLRYDDAAKTYKTFVALNPFHRAAPRFSMRVVETYTQGGFPKLVLEAKREFASKYGLQAEYWRRFKPEESPEVLTYLKANLKDLATHYHAEYQATDDAGEKGEHYREARRWYGDYLESFPKDADSPPINYQLADLLLENKDFGEAAKQYERTAYDYAPHAQSAAAGYAAVYAHRERLKGAPTELRDGVKRDTVASSLKFADAFPEHEHAAAILGAAADDMYEMKDYRAGRGVGAARSRRLSGRGDCASGARRGSSLRTARSSSPSTRRPSRRTPRCWRSRRRVTRRALGSSTTSPPRSTSRVKLANEAQDYRAAADHFLRIRSAAPTSVIRAAAEYDAGAALIRLEDWTAAASVLEAFRSTYPEARAAGRGRQADRQRLPAEAASCRAPRANTSASPRVRGSDAARRGAAHRRRPLRAIEGAGSCARRVHALRQGVPASRSRRPWKPASRSPRSYKAANDESPITRS